MKLKDILEIKPGALIKGLRIRKSGVIELSLDGWDIQKNSVWDADRHPFSFKFYDDKRVQRLISNNRIERYKPNNVQYSVLRKNGECYYKDIRHWFCDEEIFQGECVGMSIGKSFIAIQPHQADIYRPDFYEIYVFHQILHGEKLKWIVLQSKTQYKGLLVIEPDKVLLDINMNLL